MICILFYFEVSMLVSRPASHFLFFFLVNLLFLVYLSPVFFFVVFIVRFLFVVLLSGALTVHWTVDLLVSCLFVWTDVVSRLPKLSVNLQ